MIHLFSMYGMGGHTTDPGQDNFVARVKAELPHINTHDSPYRDYDCANIAAMIDRLPDEDIVFVAGTSLGSNDAPVVGMYATRRIDGIFGFQASIYGYHSHLTQNVKFAHLISSYNPIPLPGLGAYVWQVGSMTPESFHHTVHNIPHPGDYDLHDQMTFINEMKHIIG